jgi:DNA-binding transcriptional ArsR family regulator
MMRFDGEAALRALADPRRRRMLELAWDCERSPGELAASCQLSRPATSQHLRVLREAGLVSVRLDKNRRLYRVRAGRLAELRAMLDEFWGCRLASLRAELARDEGTGP